MSLDPELARAIDDAVDAEAAALARLAGDLHAHPELRFEEIKAAGWIAELLAARHHEVERGLAGMPTAFRTRAGAPGGPRRAGPRGRRRGRDRGRSSRRMHPA